VRIVTLDLSHTALTLRDLFRPGAARELRRKRFEARRHQLRRHPESSWSTNNKAWRLRRRHL
jgi:hypothetical protein